MVKKTFTYTDYEGTERTEDHFFNLTEAELIEMEYSLDGGMQKMLEEIVKTKNATKIMSMFKVIISKAYGVKSPDGRRFMKKPEYFEAFSETDAYNQLIMELLSDTNAASAFINGIVPKTATA